MRKSSYFDGPGLILEHAIFPHLIGVEWDALNRLAAISGEAFVMLLMRPAIQMGNVLPYMSLWTASSPSPIGEV